MARAADRLPQNASGNFFVDRSCIDCEACRQIAPRTFARSDSSGRSFVRTQPANDAEQLRAAMALVSCPTSSIGTERKIELRTATGALPERIDDDVFFCGFTSEASFGALSYFVRRDAGNVLVDSPRAAELLIGALEKAGGVRTMFLTHQDDVADHAQYAARFGCERIIHAADWNRRTRDVERRIDSLEPIALAPDLLMIPTPGHTAGSSVLLYKNRFLFTGDHLAASEDGSELEAWRGVCWYSWPEQTRSMERLLDYSFEWVLPGHGRRFHAEPVRMKREMERLVEWMRRA